MYPRFHRSSTWSPHVTIPYHLGIFALAADSTQQVYDATWGCNIAAMTKRCDQDWQHELPDWCCTCVQCNVGNCSPLQRKWECNSRVRSGMAIWQPDHGTITCSTAWSRLCDAAATMIHDLHLSWQSNPQIYLVNNTAMHAMGMV